MTFLLDVLQALRGLLRTPGFTSIALLTLALGIGASTSVFSVLHRLFLRPLPYQQEAGLVQLHTTDPQKHHPNVRLLPISGAAYQDLLDRQQVFSQVAATQPRGLNLTGEGQPERLVGLRVTGSFFPTLGVRPSLGRLLQPSDDHGPPAVVISHDLWRQRWGSDPSLIGKSILLDGRSRVVVGVLPPTFLWPREPKAFLNEGPTVEEIQGARGTLAFTVLARLKPGLTQKQAIQSMEGLNQVLAKEIPDAKDYGLGLTGLREAFYGDRRSTASFLLLTGLSVLVIACSNLANLLLARAVARQRELAMRKALGAGWSGLLRPFLADSMLLALGGGVLGTLLAWGLSGMLRPNIPPELLENYGQDQAALVFALGISFLTALLAGLVPALRFASLDPARMLQGGGRGNAHGTQGRLRATLAGAQVAITLTLLVSFGTLWSSLRNLQQAPLGFDVDRALSFVIRPNPAKYPEDSQQAAFIRDIVKTAAQLPGVTAVGSISDAPLTGGSNGDFLVPGREGEQFSAHYRSVSPGGFLALGVPLLQGRDFVDGDCQPKPAGVIVSRALAHRVWPGENPLGKTVAKYMGDPGPTQFQILGVVEDVRHEGPGADKNLDTIYWPAYGAYWSNSDRVVVRTEGHPMTLVPRLREVVRALDPDLPLAGLQPLRALLDQHLEVSRTQASLLGLLAAIALMLAAAGIYGVMAHSVTQRTREIGIRKALGAQNAQVLWEIVRRGLVLTAFGLGAGALLALALGRILATQVYRISATDPRFLAFASLVLGLVALAAAFIPARRATLMEPALTLGSE